MKPNIILSLHKNWIEEINAGRKTKEFRKSMPTMVKFPVPIWGYETKADKGRGQIVNQFILSNVEVYDLTKRGNEYQHGYDDALSLSIKDGCLTKEQFDAYYDGCEKAYVWDIFNAYKLPYALDLCDFYFKKAPQSWGYCVKSNFFCDTIKCPKRFCCDKFYVGSCIMRAQTLSPIIACGNPEVSDEAYKICTIQDEIGLSKLSEKANTTAGDVPW